MSARSTGTALQGISSVCCHPSRGVTLIELLAALAVVAVAIIGIAALYGGDQNPEQAPSQRAQAAQLAEKIAARIEQDAPGRGGYASVVGVVCSAPVRSKRADDAAARDAACWHDDVEKQLPNGLGAITRDASTTPPTFVISVSWSAAETGAASYVMRVQPGN